MICFELYAASRATAASSRRMPGTGADADRAATLPIRVTPAGSRALTDLLGPGPAWGPDS